MAAGADIVIQSLHKTLPSLTQTALAHWNRGLVDEEELARQLAVFQTSSPSYLLMGAVDRCVRLLEERGGELFAAYAENLATFDEAVKDLRHLRVLCHGNDWPEDHPDFFAFDPGKLVLCTRGTSISGPRLMEVLRKEYRIELEMALEDYALAMTSICDTRESLLRLAHALREIDSRLTNAPAELADGPLPLPPDGDAGCPAPARPAGAFGGGCGPCLRRDGVGVSPGCAAAGAGRGSDGGAVPDLQTDGSGRRRSPR